MVASYVFGYARVSSKDQNADRQVKAIPDYCRENNISIEERNILIDKTSGKDFNRHNYLSLRNILLRKGDTLIIKELDRLGRNKADIKKELEYLHDKGIRVKILNIPTTLIDFEGEQSPQWVLEMINNILIEVLGAIAEEERLKIRERQREGIAIAKQQGKKFGRPKITFQTLTTEQQQKIKENYLKWQKKEITATKFMQMIDLKRNTFYKIMKEYEANYLQ